MDLLSRRGSESRGLKKTVEIIKDRLYYVAVKGEPAPQEGYIFFSVDRELEYWNFFLDFGPLNLGQLFKFCQLLIGLLKDPALTDRKIVYYSARRKEKRANATFLISAFSMLYLHKTPKEAFYPFRKNSLPPFHDATPFECTYKLTVLDCLKGLDKAVKMGFLDFDNFQVEEYEFYERVENGDFNWIIQDKFLAFAGPFNRKEDSGDGYLTLTPEDYIPYFQKHGVKLVIRLNEKKYDKEKFVQSGIKHVDLIYPDGTNPPLSVLKQFLAVCEQEKGAIAVHCKAGLGRTGTLIGCYMMKHYGFSAAEAIGWLRIARPGSVIGPQQYFLEDMEPVMRQKRNRSFLKESKYSRKASKSDKAYSPVEILIDGEPRQGHMLRLRKSQLMR